MKPSSLTGLLTLALVCLTLSSATPTRNAHRPAEIKALYYWYWADSDFFISFNTTSAEINDLQTMTGFPVDTNPFGTRVANGYISNVYPHNMWPTVVLYHH